ncbi:MAG: hypothetical protein HYR73_06375 [Candidatus Eisenbacteria bacterium]|nr:hypothetical protein [Candidatus Eisenbacteria bacterium]
MRRTRERDRGLPEQALEFLPDDPHHLLTRREALQHLLTDRRLLDTGHEIPRHG